MSKSPTAKITLNTRLLPLICFIALAFVILDGYRGWSVLLVGSGGVWLFSYLWARALAQGLAIHREIRFGWAQVGDRLEERFILTNRARVPALWVEVVGQSNMPDYWANQVRAVNRQSETRWSIRGLCTRRGLYTLGPTTLQTSDPFGVYSIILHDPAAITLMVIPPILPLPQIQVAPGGRAGDGTPRVHAPEPIISASSLREYTPNDSLRWIHWPTSAKHNEFFVRVFEGAPAGDWWIMLDLERSAQVGEGYDTTDEYGILLAASLTDRGMRAGRSVGLLAHSHNSFIWHPPRMSDEARWSILRSLALVEPGDISLSELLNISRPQLGQNTSLILITPAVKGKWIEALLSVRRLGVVPTVLLLDPVSFGGRISSDDLHAQLTSLGITCKIIPRSLLDYRQRYDQPPAGVVPTRKFRRRAIDNQSFASYDRP
jgi:uncharacterized protein (DUF58 family)